jgi:hypothetical protein
MGISLSSKHNDCIAWRCLMLTVLLTFICYSCPAQNSLLDKKMSLSKKRYTVYELCNAIEKQVDASVSYNSAKIKSKKRISISRNATDLRTLLGMLKKDYNIDCNIVGNHIILIPAKGFTNNRARHSKRKRKTETQKVAGNKQKAAAPTPNKMNKVSQADSSINAQVVMTTDTTGGTPLLSNSAGGSIDNVNYESEPASARYWEAITENLIAGVSFYVSQPYYFNTQAALGYKYVYFSLAYAFKGNGLGHWRFGGGFTIPASQKIDLDLHADYGTGINITAPYSYETSIVLPPVDSASDSTIITTTHTGSIVVEQNLFKAGITVGYKITPVISVFISPCFNTLNTAYFQDGTAVSLRSVIPDPVVIDAADFQPLNTGLNISDGYSPDATSYRKNWVSIEVGLRIHIFPKNKF